MRMIDADARVTVFSFDIKHEEYEHIEMSVAEALDFTTNNGCPDVVDAEPVLHGRWIFHGGNGPMDIWLTCSVCGKESGVHEGNYYCHWCGAKMDGGPANETN